MEYKEFTTALYGVLFTYALIVEMKPPMTAMSIFLLFRNQEEECNWVEIVFISILTKQKRPKITVIISFVPD